MISLFFDRVAVHTLGFDGNQWKAKHIVAHGDYTPPVRPSSAVTEILGGKQETHTKWITRIILTIFLSCFFEWTDHLHSSEFRVLDVDDFWMDEK